MKRSLSTINTIIAILQLAAILFMVAGSFLANKQFQEKIVGVRPLARIEFWNSWGIIFIILPLVWIAAAGVAASQHNTFATIRVVNGGLCIRLPGRVG